MPSGCISVRVSTPTDMQSLIWLKSNSPSRGKCALMAHVFDPIPDNHEGRYRMSNLYQCFVCGEMFEFGEHAYHGRVVHEWLGKMICNHCETSNWDGIVPEEKLIKRFREAGINEEYTGHSVGAGLLS